MGTRTSDLEPVRYIFCEPGNGWIVKEERETRDSSETTVKEDAEAPDAVVWAGVMKKSPFWYRDYVVEVNFNKKAAPLTKSAADCVDYQGSCFPTLVLSRSGREGRPLILGLSACRTPSKHYRTVGSFALSNQDEDIRGRLYFENHVTSSRHTSQALSERPKDPLASFSYSSMEIVLYRTVSKKGLSSTTIGKP